MKSICAVEGVRAAGIKEGKFGLALIEANGAAAAVFTRNQVVAEPVKLMKERMKACVLDGIIVNSGNANVYTGDAGAATARRMCEIAAEAFGTTPDRVGVASTGVIGRFPDTGLIERQCTAIAPRLRSDASAEDDAAAAIMTTDLFPKHAMVRGEGFTVAGITKGSGMIAPNMGTMLAFLYTDAALPADELQSALAVAVDRSFNRVVVDGDTSTNDCVFLTATARKGRPDADVFQAALEEVCVTLARQIAADGEGATKLLEVRVSGARTEDEAAAVARTVVGSPLVKTAVYGQDPNWGRVVAAAGRAGVPLDTGTVTVSLIAGDEEVVFAQNGAILADTAGLARAKALMAGDTVTFALDLGDGAAAATAWGCDLTEKYVEINGKYTT